MLTDTKLVSSALHWSLDYLAKNMGAGEFSVYECDSPKFKYYDEKKGTGPKGFKSASRRVDMKFADFVNRITNSKPGDRRWVNLCLL